METGETHRERSLRVLEWPKVQQDLLGCCQWVGGAEVLRSFGPLVDVEEVGERQQTVREAIRLESEGKSRHLGGMSDPRPWLRAALKGKVLACDQLLDVELLCTVSKDVYVSMKERSDLPRLKDLVETVVPHPRLEQRLRRSISRDGKITDEASTALRNLRAAVREAESRLQSSLQSLLRHPELSRTYQEPIITQREGRFVIPVKAEYKGRFPGLVIDQSASGSTLFMEPYIAVNQGNDLRQKKLAEERECHRILVELSQAVADHAGPLLRAAEALGRFDAFLALGRYSFKVGGELPEVTADGELDMRKARHPLLGEACIPISMELKGGTRTLVITGPNTGGKTVALKTTGLLCLMASSGFPVPVRPGSTFPLIAEVWADIGDEQSLSQSLSTFSGHLIHILEILRSADRRSLVLLDELGAGTDPSEGGALGIALLAELHRRGCRTVVSTHLSQLKIYAKQAEGFDNAAVEFNPETLRPTYRLLMGIPGRSNALSIAAHLGLPEELLREARSYLGGGYQGVEELLDELEVEREAVRKAESQLKREKEKLRKARRKIQEEREELRLSKQAELETARLEGERILEETRHRSRSLMKEFKKGLEEVGSERKEALLAARRLAQEWAHRVRGEGMDFSSTPAAEEEIKFDSLGDRARSIARTMEMGLEEGGSNLPEPAPAPPKKKKESRPEEAPETVKGPDILEPQTRVYIPRFGQEGEVLGQKGQRVDVKMGTLKMTFTRDELDVLSRPQKKPEPKPGGELRPEADTAHFKVSLDLRGQSVDEACLEVDRFIDRACLAKVERVELLHGKGTGALRLGIQQHLKRHRQVAGFRDGDPYEGGWGVTVVNVRT
ncbi:MAG: Smr/MutS family protein [Vulcanimicrobiota bacterium]